MKLAIAALAVAALMGLASGGTFAGLGALRIRLAILAVVGLGLQVVPVPGRVLPLALLYVSFAILFAFGLLNRRLVGVPLILLGILLNFTVIAANGGMPVTGSALVASGQQDTLTFLINDGGAKHHLASGQDVLLPLADVWELYEDWVAERVLAVVERLVARPPDARSGSCCGSFLKFGSYTKPLSCWMQPIDNPNA